MTTPQTPDLAAIKGRQQKAWSSGDYGKVGVTLLVMAERLAEAADLRSGQRVLDVACGNGNASLAAARRFCDVTGIDYVPMLLEEARNRTEAEGLDVDFMEGDAENLPFEDASFDVVLSTLGVMFAPDREKAAGGLRRVGATSTSYWVPNTTPNDVLLILESIADPSYTTPELSAEMLGIMTGTSFEDRLPQPLPEDARVAHKIGSWETTFSDAGIVLPEGAKTAEEGYYVVVFSEGVPEGVARETIRDVSLEAYRALTPPDSR